jgi:hypothetical protein
MMDFTKLFFNFHTLKNVISRQYWIIGKVNKSKVKSGKVKKWGVKVEKLTNRVSLKYLTYLTN